MAEIYVGDIVRLSDEHGGLVGTLKRVSDDKDGEGQYAVVQLSGTASITVPPESLTYAGPPIPPEPADDDALVLLGRGVYRRCDKGWEPALADGAADTGIGAMFAAIDEPCEWGLLIRRHGHAKPQRLVAVELESQPS